MNEGNSNLQQVIVYLTHACDLSCYTLMFCLIVFSSFVSFAKARSLKLQTHRTELDRVAATHAKTLATIERTQNKSRTSDSSFKNAALIKDHEALVIIAGMLME